MSKLGPAVLKSKFRGCLLGSLLGDCLGGPYEGDIISPGDLIIIQRYFDKMESAKCTGIYKSYTDDTAMMKSIASSLVEKPEVDFTHMAQLFVKEYYSESFRGYGQNVVDVFAKLRKTKFQDVFKPAQEQFGGRGSFGNGGAMRIAPVPLFFHDNFKMMNDTVKKSTLITHANYLGVNGAILQSLAIHQALHCNHEEEINPQDFCNRLKEAIQPFEAEYDDGLGLGDTKPYQDKLKLVEMLLETPEHEEMDCDVIQQIGNSIVAHESVPTAIYCFLRALLNNITSVKTDNLFRRTIQYAITLGGDTDTIACMAGAIAGAYVGEEGINANLITHCESYSDIIELADGLYDVAIKE